MRLKQSCMQLFIKITRCGKITKSKVESRQDLSKQRGERFPKIRKCFHYWIASFVPKPTIKKL